METIFFVQDLKLSEKELHIGVGDEVVLQVLVKPEAARERKLQWASDAPDIVTVTEEGIIRALSTGEVTIFVRCDYGFDSCTVIVGKGVQKIHTVRSFDGLLNGVSVQLPVQLEKGNGKLIFTSQNDELVTISEKGRMSFRDIGETRVKIIAEETDLFLPAEVEISVDIKKMGLESPSVKKIYNSAAGIKIKWSAADNATGYYIYRQKDKEDFEKIAVVDRDTELLYLDKQVESGFKYTYFVRAFNKTKISSMHSAEKSLIYLQMPEWEQISSENGRVYLRWKISKGAQGYYIYRKDGNNEWKGIANVEGEENIEFEDRVVKSGQSYSYVVRAYNENMVSSFEVKEKSLVYLDTPELNRVNNVAGAIRMNWNRIEGATGYFVYRKSDTEDWKAIKALTDGDVLSYEDTDVESGKLYHYTVRACMQEILSGYDSIGKSILCLLPPEINAISNGNGYINIKWSHIEGASGYYVYRKGDKEDWYLLAALKGEMAIGYNDSDVEFGKVYWYTVRAYRGKELGSYLNEGTGIICLEMPEISALEKRNDCIMIYWNHVCGATGYYLYRKEESGNWNRIATINQKNVFSYADKEIECNSTYIYTIRAHHGSMLSAFDTEGKSIMLK